MMDDESFIEMRSRRAGALAAIMPTNEAEKSFLRQKTNINNIREKVEKQLRIMKEYLLDTSTGNVKKKFTQNNKTVRMKEL